MGSFSISVFPLNFGNYRLRVRSRRVRLWFFINLLLICLTFTTEIFSQEYEIVLITNKSIFIKIYLIKQSLILDMSSFGVDIFKTIIQCILKLFQTHNPSGTICIVTLSMQSLNRQFTEMLFHTEINLCY